MVHLFTQSCSKLREETLYSSQERKFPVVFVKQMTLTGNECVSSLN